MTSMGVLMNDDPMEDALKFVRQQPRLLEDQRVAAGGATAVVEASKPINRPSSQAAATTARTDVGRWLDAERRRRNLEAELKALVTEQDRLRQQILERWSMDGTSKEVVDGYTVHMQRKLYPKVVDVAAFVKAAIKEGREFLLTVDAKTLAVWATAKEEEGEPLPPSIAAHMGDSFERFDLRVRTPGRAH